MKTKLIVSRTWNVGTVEVLRQSWKMEVTQVGDAFFGIPKMQWKRVMFCRPSDIDEFVDMYMAADPTTQLWVNGHDFSPVSQS